MKCSGRSINFMHSLVNNHYRADQIERFQQREELISKLKHRFKTYGYKQIQTSAFEKYDMYATKTGIVNTEDMIKIIDASGEVLVLRPDITIPLTQWMTNKNQLTVKHDRYFYVMDVFRHAEWNEQKERTQAGIEYFGDSSPTVDAEVIALAIHTLHDCGFSDYKIEIGHAGFFKALIAQTSLSTTEITNIQRFIQSKNLAEMTAYLESLTIDEPLKTAIRNIPFLYGQPKSVINEINQYGLDNEVKAELQKLIDVYTNLQAYDLSEDIVFNLGLINDMDYYSDIIFQGFINQIGRPVVMGGRYDNLGDQFGTHIPAIGFAFDVDLLIHAASQHHLLSEPESSIDICLYYDTNTQQEAVAAAFHLRNQGYSVISFPKETSETATIQATWEIMYTENVYTAAVDNQIYQFKNFVDLQGLLQAKKENG
ncbi:ATP phosphoribosyltransferase regulatory subunit [Virgibacillus massiliensis]|nr:ATP phosphoribosyltransferase regulatory subunit [Virgibacillus massiliensis]